MECPHGKTVSPAICKRFHSDPKEGVMESSTKTTRTTRTTRKPAPAKKTTTAAKKVRKQATPMPASVRKAAAAAVAAFEATILEQEDIGFIGSNTRELKGARSGLTAAARFEVSNIKHRAVITVAYR